MTKSKAQEQTTAKKKTADAAAAVSVVVKEKVKSKASTAKKAYSINSYGTGRRKNSIARVWVRNGTGEVEVNYRAFDNYFTREAHRKMILSPFAATKTLGQYDVFCTIRGGGVSGQAGALLHGIARALDKVDPTAFHQILSSNGFLTRDSRVVERKKYGKHKARRSTQFSKR